MRTVRILTLAATSLLVVAAVVFAATHSSRQKPQNRVGAISRTKAFEIISVTQSNNEFTIALKNRDLRRITAFTLSAGPEFSITKEWIFSEVGDDVGIKPQAIFSETYPLPGNLQQTSFDVVVKAVVFDDGTGDGDILVYEDIKERRLGQAIQMRRALKMLQTVPNSRISNVDQFKADLTDALNASDSDTLKDLLEFEPTGVINRISNGPLSDTLKVGLANGRESVLRRISESETPNGFDNGLLRIKQTYERLLRRF